MRRPNFPPGVTFGGPPFIGVHIHHDDVRLIRQFRAFKRIRQFGRILHRFGDGTHGPRMRFEVHTNLMRGRWCIRNQVVEAVLSDVVLQLVDNRKPAIIEHKANQLFLCQNGRIQVRVHHHIGTIPTEGDRVPVRRHLRLGDARTPRA